MLHECSSNDDEKCCLAILLNEPGLDGTDYLEFVKLLSAAFGANYLEPDSPQNEKASLVFRLAQEKRFSKREFAVHVRRFILTQKYPNWTIADFFQFERERLYPRSWAEAEWQKNASAMRRMESYLVGDTVLYRYATGQRLPLVMVHPTDERNQQPVPSPDIDYKKRCLELESDVLAANERARKMSQAIAILEQKYNFATEAVKDLTKENFALKRRIEEISSLSVETKSVLDAADNCTRCGYDCGCISFCGKGRILCRDCYKKEFFL